MRVPILLPNIFNYPFTYDTKIKLKLGDYVEVPFGKSKATGVVWDEFEKNINKNFVTKQVIKKFNIPSLNKNLIKFLNWFSEYNMIPKGMALKLLLLSSKVIEELPNKNYDNFNYKIKNQEFKLTLEQKENLKNMNFSNQKFKVHVLQGVTGSGKTIVYFEALRKILKNGFQGLILLPEIGLTSQFEKKFIDFFGFKSAICHSGVTKKKQRDYLEWNCK